MKKTNPGTQQHLTAFAKITGFVLADQFTKYMVVNHVCRGGAHFGKHFAFQYTENRGVAFGIPLPVPLILIGTVVLLAVVAHFAHKELDLTRPRAREAVALILAGGLGNLIDRIFRGAVVDFISIWKYPSFNLADVYIVVGILLIIVFYGKIKKQN